MELGWTWINEIRLGTSTPKKQKGPIGRPRGSVKPKTKTIKDKKYGTDRIYCSACNCYIQRRIQAQHKRTLKHIYNDIDS